LGKAISLLKEHRDKAKLLAGGTDLIVRMKKRAITPRVVIDLNRISELSFMEMRGDMLCIGAGTRLTEILQSKLIQEKAGILVEAIRVLASPGIRNRATIGGNLCNASPTGDTAPPLLALDASVKLEGPGGERVVPLSQFFTGHWETVRSVDEVMTEVTIPRKKGRYAFLKIGKRKGFTQSIVSVAVFANIVDGRFEDVRVSLGAVAETPIINKKTEALLKGAKITQDNIERASEAVKAELEPPSNIRASAEYRKEMASLLVKRALSNLVQ
jgi:CO/xanthine dehydrogenase FAD-binding subunit